MLSKQEKLYLIKIIRRELKSKRTDWHLVVNLSAICDLSDTAFREMLAERDKKSLLRDYLLSLTYQKNKKISRKSLVF